MWVGAELARARQGIPARGRNGASTHTGGGQQPSHHQWHLELLEERGGRADALRFEELEVALRAKHHAAVRDPGAVVALLGELASPDDRADDRSSGAPRTMTRKC